MLQSTTLSNGIEKSNILLLSGLLSVFIYTTNGLPREPDASIYKNRYIALQHQLQQQHDKNQVGRNTIVKRSHSVQYCRQLCEGIYDQCLSIVFGIPEQLVCLNSVNICRRECSRKQKGDQMIVVSPTFKNNSKSVFRVERRTKEQHRWGLWMKFKKEN